MDYRASEEDEEDEDNAPRNIAGDFPVLLVIEMEHLKEFFSALSIHNQGQLFRIFVCVLR